MNIYFAASTNQLEKNRDNFLAVIAAFKDAGHTVLESWVVETLAGSKQTATSQELVLKNTQLVQESDLVVIDLSERSFGAGYIFGQALANHRPVLCLYPHDVPEQRISEIVKGSTSSLVTVRQYSPEKIDEIIRDYLAGISLDSLRKFNFIATEEIVKFIEQGADREGKSKSQYLRDLLHSTFIAKK
ncbi:MAG: Nucleoside 2-deoxyribosyltransferase [candidate division WS6 bacterium OLB20]|uniref:Nucleoside 2-deoxyribosyltransferase n=1 Tax=candidate division WS6 bacterium OLB20 TaxID=1617426 RepID=A0A136LX40_9BACT|nr:MAG: Nucleoside 2-deoxyribosyltransferase [candidate division WS6 bacterium OLB20]